MRTQFIAGRKLIAHVGFAVLAVAACFSPNISDGVSCSESRECPAGQICNSSGVCKSPGEDVPRVDARTTRIDGNVIDTPDADPCLPGSRTFEHMGSIVTFELPDCIDKITVEAFGAQGGGGIKDSTIGGKGARVRGDFTLLDGEVLSILVGGRGIDGAVGSPNFTYEQAGGTGGGGSFVVSDGIALIVAGGGGGATDRKTPRPGGDGQTGADGQDGGEGGLGGIGGQGGKTASNPDAFHTGTGGGGFSGDGDGQSDGGSQFGTPNAPGKGFANMGSGGTAGTQGRAGGFGGGGAAGYTGGGGGGFSGGGAGGSISGNVGIGGGGGGSFNAGLNKDSASGANTGDGRIVITW